MSAPDPNAGREWYADGGASGGGGLRFECTMCGRCCTGPPGYVRYTHDEAVAMARVLGISLDEFEDRYTKIELEQRTLGEVESEHGLDCVFLDWESVPGKAVCKVYEARPLQCRTFPWWPQNLRSKRDWERLGRECEGVGRGDFVPIEHIRIERDKQASRDRSVGR